MYLIVVGVQHSETRLMEDSVQVTVTPDVTFSIESAQDHFYEAMPLLREHWKEITHWKDIPLEPDIDGYKQIEDAGMLRCYIARSAGQMVGYAVFFIRTNLHYKSSKQALQDVIYIDPQFRGIGLKFVDWCDQQLRADGVQVVFHHFKNKRDFGVILESKLNYELIDVIYGRRLDR